MKMDFHLSALETNEPRIKNRKPINRRRCVALGSMPIDVVHLTLIPAASDQVMGGPQRYGRPRSLLPFRD
jgi:hypothetical protein